MKKPSLDLEEILISFNDIKYFCLSMWKKLIKWGVIGGIGSFLYFLNLPVTYEAIASFKEGIERNSSSSFFQEFMGGMVATAHQPQAAVIMKSNQVLKPLVETLGLQIHFCDREWFLQKIFRKYQEGWKAAKGLPLKDLDSFRFEQVKYEEEKPFFFHLVFTDETHFVVFDEEKKKELGKGCINERWAFNNLHFTLIKTSKNLKAGKFYPFYINSWVAETGALRSMLTIKKDKDHASLILITAAHRDRFLATNIVNELMRVYQSHLKNEYDHVASQQLLYLEKRQNQLVDQIGELFKEQSTYFEKNLKENGFLGLEQESQSLLVPHQKIYNQVLQIDTELARIDQMEKKGDFLAALIENPFSSQLNQISQTLHELKQQRDLLELSLSNTHEKAFSNYEKLKEIRSQRYEIEKLMQEVHLGEEISSYDLNEGLCLWAKEIKDLQERKDFENYLENYARLLSMQEKMLQERVFYVHEAPKELEGIDLDSAKNLLMQYNGKLDQTQATLKHYSKLKEQIPNADFDLASLSSVLHDSLSQKLIADASELNLKLKDEKHYSEKEEKRWNEEIALYRKILLEHINQLDGVEELNADLIRQKMSGLQEMILDGVNRQISVLKEQASDLMKERRSALILEKKLLQKEMRELRDRLARVLPEKWFFEKWLNMKMEMAKKVMETVTEVVESKSISNQMHHVESKPLDLALVPSSLKPSKLFFMSFLGAFASSFFVFSFALIRKMMRGFPATLEKLKALKLPVLGSISSFCDGPFVEKPSGADLDLLRKVALFSERAKIIGLIANKGPDYSYALGENLGRQQVKTLIIRCDFLGKFRKEESPGLLQICQEEITELPIRRGKGFDYLTSGGFSPFGTEMIQSARFEKLLELLKKNYDQIYLLFRSELASAESQAALKLCEKAVVSVCKEPTEELTPFIHWGYSEKECRITFISAS